MHVDATIAAAIIAAAVAALGYGATQYAQRRERRSRVYADALRSIRAVQELPYRVWRRADDSPTTIEAMGKLQSEALSEVMFYAQWLRIETPLIGRIFELLQRKTRYESRIFRRRAWESSLLSLKQPLGFDDSGFRYTNGPELLLCVEAMKADVSWWGWFARRRLKRRLAELEDANKETLTRPGSLDVRVVKKGLSDSPS